MPMCSFVSLTSLIQKLPLNKASEPGYNSTEHLLHADESLHFCLLSELFNYSKAIGEPKPPPQKIYFLKGATHNRSILSRF